MGDKSKIEWTDATWNPVTGCSHVSPGCQHCYAEALSHRYKWTTKPWSAQNAAENVRVHPERLDQPFRWRRPRRVFVNSMSDLFHEAVPDDFIENVFAVMAEARTHTFQVLTKRPERMLRYCRERFTRPTGYTTPFPNVWLGVSVEDQQRADERIPLLLETPAVVRWVSAEPLLGPVDLGKYLLPTESLRTITEREPHWLNWVVVGGESGPGARPFDVAWARDLVQQCRAAGVSVFVKQLGTTVTGIVPWAARFVDRKGGDPSEWPEDLRVREWPQ